MISPHTTEPLNKSALPMARCYEFFNCPYLSCPAHGSAGKNCWDMEDTNCQSACRQFLQAHHKVENKACDICLYYREQGCS